MGLGVSHDCWSGPYGQFMRWRTWLAAQVGIPLPLMDGFYRWEWEEGDLKFDHDYYAIDKSLGGHPKSTMLWETLSGFQGLGRPVSWSLFSHDPLVKLLHHSDCDGSIKWWDCIPIALRLRDVLRQCDDDSNLPMRNEKTWEVIWSDWRSGRGCYDGMVPATKRFMAGLIRAHKAREKVIFR